MQENRKSLQRLDVGVVVWMGDAWGEIFISCVYLLYSYALLPRWKSSVEAGFPMQENMACLDGCGFGDGLDFLLLGSKCRQNARLWEPKPSAESYLLACLSSVYRNLGLGTSLECILNSHGRSCLQAQNAMVRFQHLRKGSGDSPNSTATTAWEKWLNFLQALRRHFM